jgi:hypothetical protein
MHYFCCYGGELNRQLDTHIKLKQLVSSTVVRWWRGDKATWTADRPLDAALKLAGKYSMEAYRAKSHGNEGDDESCWRFRHRGHIKYQPTHDVPVSPTIIIIIIEPASVNSQNGGRVDRDRALPA